MTRETDAINREGAEREARRKAAPVASTLLETLIAAQTALKGDQEAIARYIIVVGAHIDSGAETSDADAERVLRECALWPSALIADKVEAGDFGTMRAVQFGGVWRWVSDFGPVATLPVTHAVIIGGVEVARIPAKNDWHAVNKAKKLFGPDARAVKMLDEPPAVADPFSRIKQS